jgi:hypothetical protein
VTASVERHTDEIFPPPPQGRVQREAPKAEYLFRQEGAPKLRPNHKEIDKVDRNNHPDYVADGHLPDD